ncbi:MAG TPA: argininosuccinate lyase [Candidatus Angelobacter sp.]|jgi:argininosuccinate lyase|nr:argininosuccinate lyase [Candidatus Angelobacter sp.]
MWSGRFSQELNAEFEQWQRSFPFDRILVPYEVAASQAHAAALAKAGVLTSGELSLTQKALKQIAAEEIPADDDPSIEDVHHFVEKRLVELAGEVGLKLHTGRSRNEQIATDLRLYVRAQTDAISLLLVELAGEFVAQAENAGDAAMPSYTHLQRAEPVLVAHWLLAYVEMIMRDLSRLADCRKRLNQCPLGSAAVAGTILPLDRAGIAKTLEFDMPTANSIDATSDRDFAIEFVQALSSVALHLSRWAEESILFATTEYGFVKLPEAYSTGSSAMPQKKNPDALELIRGKAARVFADATALFMTVKGLPLAYNKDMQETQQPVFAAALQVASMVRVATGFMAGVGYDFARMQGAASTGYMNALAGAAYLVRSGVPFRSAHEKIGKAVQLCVERGCELEHLSAEDLASCGITADAAFYEALQLQQVLAIHDVPGGTAPSQVRAALKQAKETLLTYAGAAHVCA